MLAKSTSAPKSSMSFWSKERIVAKVATGMNAGVEKEPWEVLTLPKRAFDFESSLIILNANIGKKKVKCYLKILNEQLINIMWLEKADKNIEGVD